MRVFLGLLIIGLPLVSGADSVEPVDSVENFVNVRQLPEPDAEVVGRLYKGIPLPLVEAVDGWNAVEMSDGATGFVSADWSQIIVTEVEPEPVVEPVEPELVEELVEPDAAEEPVEAESVEELVEPEPVDELVEPDVAEDLVEPDPVEVEVPTATETVDEPEAPEIEEPTEPAPIEEPVVPEVVEVVAVEDHREPLTIKGKPDFLVKFKEPTSGTSSQIFDNGNQIGIGTTEPEQRLEVNGNIQIHDQNSSVAGLMITQSSGETGYIMHNRASTLTIGAGSVDRLTIDRHGNVGIGVSRPAHPLEMANGAHVSTGGVWINSSSRDRKENIEAITVEEALAALAGLEPVHYNYKNDSQESYVGFIAEDVPGLVATSNRKGLSAMDIVAVLTKVMQAQQQQIKELEAQLEAIR